MWLYGRKLLIVCNHCVRFGGYTHCGSGDKMFLIYDMSLRDCVVKGLCCLMGWSILLVSPHLVRFSGHRPCGSSDTSAKIFYVTLEGHIIKGSGGL